jgi:hypothetical protein
MKKSRVGYKFMCTQKLSRQEVRLTHIGGESSLLFNRALSQYILSLSTVYIKFAIRHDPQQLVPVVIPHSVSPRYDLMLVTQLLTRIRCLAMRAAYSASFI